MANYTHSTKKFVRALREILFHLPLQIPSIKKAVFATIPDGPDPMVLLVQYTDDNEKDAQKTFGLRELTPLFIEEKITLLDLHEACMSPSAINIQRKGHWKKVTNLSKEDRRDLFPMLQAEFDHLIRKSPDAKDVIPMNCWIYSKQMCVIKDFRGSRIVAETDDPNDALPHVDRRGEISDIAHRTNTGRLAIPNRRECPYCGFKGAGSCRSEAARIAEGSLLRLERYDDPPADYISLPHTYPQKHANSEVDIGFTVFYSPSISATIANHYKGRTTPLWRRQYRQLAVEPIYAYKCTQNPANIFVLSPNSGENPHSHLDWAIAAHGTSVRCPGCSKDFHCKQLDQIYTLDTYFIAPWEIGRPYKTSMAEYMLNCPHCDLRFARFRCSWCNRILDPKTSRVCLRKTAASMSLYTYCDHCGQVSAILNNRHTPFQDASIEQTTFANCYKFFTELGYEAHILGGDTD